MRLALLALLIPSVAAADDTATWAGEVNRALKRHDTKAIAARLATPLKHAGAWFPDAACTKRFAQPGVLQTKDRDAFARCFAKLVPQLSTRASSYRDGAVITAEPGIELELLFDTDGKIRWFGPAGGTGDNGTPMLTAQAFEALRTAGSTLLDDKVRELDRELTKSNPASAWIRTCLDENGAATRAVAWSSTPATGDVFLRATSDWAFRAFRVPACSMSLLTYPASKAPPVETLPKGVAIGPRIVTYQFEDDLDFTGALIKPLPQIATIQPAELAALAAGPLDPTPATPAQLKVAAPDRLSSINVCISEKGDVRNVVTLDQQPGDRQRASKIWRWKRFKPYLRNGVATEACALLQFVVRP